MTLENEPSKSEGMQYATGEEQRAITNSSRNKLRGWAKAEKTLAQRFPASSLLAREGAGCGSVGDVPGAWLASAPLSPSLWT